MGLFSRRTSRPPAAWQPPRPPDCGCARHLDDELRGTVVPFSARLVEELGSQPGPVTVADLLHPGGLSVRPARSDEQVPDEPADLTWDLGVYDDARAHYDDVEDGAEVELDAALAGQPGIDRVEWCDREVLLLAAPTLCAEGVLAAAATTLLDGRLRASG